MVLSDSAVEFGNLLVEKYGFWVDIGCQISLYPIPASCSLLTASFLFLKLISGQSGNSPALVENGSSRWCSQSKIALRYELYKSVKKIIRFSKSSSWEIPIAL